jgi:hypothetical protein
MYGYWKYVSALILVIPSFSFAAPITLQSTWFGYGENPIFTFTFEDSVADNNVDPQRGFYADSILSLDLMLKGVRYSLNSSFGAGSISIFSQNPTVLVGPAAVFISAPVIGSDGFAGEMTLRVEEYIYPLTDALHEVVRVRSDESTYIFLSSSSPSPFLMLTHASDGGELFSVVPVPAAIWLFGSAVVGMVGISRNRLRVS